MSFLFKFFAYQIFSVYAPPPRHKSGYDYKYGRAADIDGLQE